MLKKRLIPVLLLKNGLLVRSESFFIHQIIGNPIHEVQRFNQWNVDEIIYLDISREENYDIRRNDTKVKGLNDPMQILNEVSKNCFVPLTWGGRIRNLEDMKKCFLNGADKVVLNTCAVTNPMLIKEGSNLYGSQAIVISIDVKRQENGRMEVFINGGKTPTGLEPIELAKKVEELGAGEIILQSIDRDGLGEGYDIELIKEIVSVTKIPIIACSGVGVYEDFVEGIEAGASAVAAANIWHFKELVDRNAKRIMRSSNINVRL